MNVWVRAWIVGGGGGGGGLHHRGAWFFLFLFLFGGGGGIFFKKLWKQNYASILSYLTGKDPPSLYLLKLELPSEK